MPSTGSETHLCCVSGCSGFWIVLKDCHPFEISGPGFQWALQRCVDVLTAICSAIYTLLWNACHTMFTLPAQTRNLKPSPPKKTKPYILNPTACIFWSYELSKWTIAAERTESLFQFVSRFLAGLRIVFVKPIWSNISRLKNMYFTGVQGVRLHVADLWSSLIYLVVRLYLFQWALSIACCLVLFFFRRCS